MEDEDDSISSSPTPVKARSFKRFRHRHKKETSVLLDNFTTNSASATGSQLGCEREALHNNNNDQVSRFEQEQRLFEADRLDCQLAQQEPLRPRVVPASQNFMSLQLMLESQQLPQEEAESDPETSVKCQNNIMEQILNDFSVSSLDEAATNPQIPVINIVQEILKDFCSSPGYEKDEPPVYYVSPQFRFYNKKLRTYGRRWEKQPTTHVTTDHDDDDDERMSCSSGLSVQEDVITQMPTTSHCDFDANSSQRICENLLNLSAFFTQNNANNSIDLPADRAQTEPMIVEEPEDASDILKDNGYLIGNTEQCNLYDDCNDTKAAAIKELTLFGGSNRLLTVQTPSKNNKGKDANLFEDCVDRFADDLGTKTTEATSKNADKPTKEANESKETNDNEFLDGIPLSEWQPMDLPNLGKKVSNSKPSLESHVCNQLEEIPFSEWQPMDIPDTVEFRTASNKTIEVPEEHQKEALKLMADLEHSPEFIVPNAPDKVEFRTASNKTVKLTDEMRKRAEMLMADLETVNDGNQLEEVSGFRTASNKNIEVTEQMQRAATNLMADIEIKITKGEEEKMLDEIPFSEWQPMEISAKGEQNDCSSQLDAIPLSEWQPVDIAESVEFRTASNRTIEVSAEMRKEAAKLMSDVEANYSQTLRAVNDESKQIETVSFRTASNKTLELTEEMKKRAAMFMADLETAQEAINDCSPSKCSTETVGLDSMHPEEVQFRTASNKTVKLTEEMRKKAAMLMADLETVQEPTDCQLPNSISERVAFPSSSNRPIEVSEAMLKAADVEMETTVKPIECDTGKECPMTATPQPRKFESMSNSVFETPRCTPELQDSLTQLTERSPLDKATKSSIITRRNLLSLNKRRKSKRDSENMDTAHTPMRQRFTPMAAATSTPVPKKRENIKSDSQCSKRDRKCLQETPARLGHLQSVRQASRNH
ncbi:hypothetical protein ACLKA7_014425 [Drosophila subpalustris]